MNRIPLTIIEEHNEVFYVWADAVERGELRPFGNTLLHVDHHPDFEAGGYPIRFRNEGLTLAQAAEMTRHALGIADFICPAIWYGLFNDIVFIGEKSLFLRKAEQRTLTLVGEKELVLGDMTAFTRRKLVEDGANTRLFAYRSGGFGYYRAIQPCVLDIDLDFFCSDDSLSTAQPKRLEMTREAYQDYRDNPYHPFRLLPKLMVTAREEDGRHYLVYEEHVPIPEPPSDKTVLNRIKLFLRWLRQYDIRPQLISICRSRHSGYTPAHRWDFIEQNLLEGLGKLYDVQSRKAWFDAV